jgi:hypothetical protein
MRAYGETSRNPPKNPQATPAPPAIDSGSLLEIRTQEIMYGANKKPAPSRKTHGGTEARPLFARSCCIAAEVAQKNRKAQVARNAAMSAIRNSDVREAIVRASGFAAVVLPGLVIVDCPRPEINNARPNLGPRG